MAIQDGAGAINSAQWQAFLSDQRLPVDYRDAAEHWFVPLVDRIVQRASEGPILVGINGCQGSGKSTLAAFLEMALPAIAQLSVAVLSVDDFYLTRAERAQLADKCHPLFATRGVPGTHDTHLMADTLDALLNGHGEVGVPRFDKALDDRVAAADWSQFEAPVDVVIWEGWCLGIPPQPGSALTTAINALESAEDEHGAWRKHVNACLAEHYQPLFAQVDLWVMLAAPSFDCVYRWRSEQEAKLRNTRRGDEQGLMSESEIARFIQFYQRLTQWALEQMPQAMDFYYELNENRAIQSLHRLNNESNV